MPACSVTCRARCDDLPGCPVATHGVYRNGKCGELLSRQPRTTPRHYSTSRACRPLYQPQFGHTTWGVLAVLHCGHTDRAGAFSTQFDARRLRLFDLEVFFLGTAIGHGILGQSAALRARQGVEHRPPWIVLGHTGTG